jgi:hypothetical protein
MTCYVTYAITGGLCLAALLWLLVLLANEIQRRLEVIRLIVQADTDWDTWAFDEGGHYDVAHWLDIRFIARLTEGVGTLVCLPSVILLLLLSARLPYFDRWGFPLLLLAIYAIPTAYILGLMAWLQLAARRARATALFHLNRMLEEAALEMGPPRSGKAKAGKERQARLEWMITAIEDLREGAFRPFAENPIVHALLIPSGGAGMLAVLTYLLPG